MTTFGVDDLRYFSHVTPTPSTTRLSPKCHFFGVGLSGGHLSINIDLMEDAIEVSLTSYSRVVDKDIKSVTQLKSLTEREIDAKQRSISSQKIRLKTSRGLWRSDRKVVQIISNKNINPLMGFTIDSVKYLTPMEALYLMESQSLEVLFDDIPLSIEQSFDLFFSNETEVDLYRVYGCLSRNGYLIKGPEVYRRNSSLTTNRRKRKLSQCLSQSEMDSNTNYYELSSAITNYKAVRGIRQLSVDLSQQKLIAQTFVESHVSPKEFDSNQDSDERRRSLMYEIQDMDSPLDINPLLVLYCGSVKPLCDLGSVLSDTDLFELMQNFGPKERNSLLKKTEKTSMKSNSILDVFRVAAKKVEKTPDLSVIVTKAEEEVPKADDIICFEEVCHSKDIGFAVIDSNDFTFYCVNRFELRPQYPVFWQKYLKSKEFQKNFSFN